MKLFSLLFVSISSVYAVPEFADEAVTPVGAAECTLEQYDQTTTSAVVTSTRQTLNFPFSNLPAPATDVTIKVSLKGDLDEDNEWYYVEGEYLLVGYAARFDIQYPHCDASFVTEDFVLSALTFSTVAVDGKFDLQLRPFRAFIDPDECPVESGALIKMTYFYWDCPPSITDVDEVDEYHYLGECAGDCDEDYDCELDLVCQDRSSSNWSAEVPGCFGDPTPGNDYCVLPKEGELVLRGNDELPADKFPLDKCEGDCDYDSECEGDLRCYQRDAYEPVPGCSGKGSEGSDYCYARIGLCQNHCTEDWYCEYGLVCYDPSLSTTPDVVPGCAFTGEGPEIGTNYCVEPEKGALVLVGDEDVPIDKFPLGLCEGECDNDDDCDGDLKCFQRDDFSPIPGCTGLGSEGSDYCYAKPPPVCDGTPYTKEYTSATETATSIGQTLLFPFIDLAEAFTDVKISVHLRGDLNSDDDWYFVEAELSEIGFAARFDNKYEQCNDAFLAEDLKMDADVYNTLIVDGALNLQLRPARSTVVNPGDCAPGGHQAFVKMSYVFCDPPLPSAAPSEQLSSVPSDMPSLLPSSI
jgi:hypothetical protein